MSPHKSLPWTLTTKIPRNFTVPSRKRGIPQSPTIKNKSQNIKNYCTSQEERETTKSNHQEQESEL